MAETLPRAYGIYRASVVGNVDPLGQSRLQVLVPEVNGQLTAWAMSCLPVGGSTEVPAVGDGVWVAYESGVTSLPVWLGNIAPIA